MRRLRPAAFAAILTLVAAAGALTACAGAGMDGEPARPFGVTVINEMPHPMIVSVDDGTGMRLLGTVGAERTERFVFHGASAATITLVARDEGDTHTVRRTVALEAGGTVEVRLN